jgi:hypothetical protein
VIARIGRARAEIVLSCHHVTIATFYHEKAAQRGSNSFLATTLGGRERADDNVMWLGWP